MQKKERRMKKMESGWENVEGDIIAETGSRYGTIKEII